ncbi:hypothetical protein [Pseudoalteromonas sp. DY56-GL79]
MKITINAIQGEGADAIERLGPVDLSSLFLQQFDWYLYKAEPA